MAHKFCLKRDKKEDPDKSGQTVQKMYYQVGPYMKI